MANQSPLHFGIMLNGFSMQYWQRACFLNLVDSGLAHCRLLIINDQEEERKSFLQKLGAFMSHKPLYHLYLRYFCKTRSRINVDCSDILSGIRQINCKTIRKGKFSEYFDQKDLEKIQTLRLDFILRFGFNIIRGEVLNIPAYGVWSFHHGDERTYRGGPTGFWEMYNNEKINGAILQRLTDTIDAGIVLKRGYFEVTAHSYPAHVDHLLMNSIHWPVSICKDILSENAGYFSDKPSTSRVKINRIPGNWKMVIFLLQQAWKKIRFHFNDLFFEEQWNIGVIEQSIGNIIESQSIKNDIHWLPLRKRSLFHADPFIFQDHDRYVMVYELFDYKTNKGIICKTSYLPGQGFSDTEVLMTAPYHLSYPCVFQKEGINYFIPEKCETGKVSLYRLESPVLKPVFIRDLITGIKAVDTTMFEYEARMWMFLTIQDDHSNLNLYAYYAENLTDEFKPHRNNPVKTDIGSARPAGNIFNVNNQFYRPSQDSSVRYGGSLKLNRLKVLTPDLFAEEEFAHFQPIKNSPYRKGLHTMNNSGNLTVIDGKRLCFIWPSFWRKLKKKIQSILT